MFRDAGGRWKAHRFDNTDLFMPINSLVSQYNTESKQQYELTSLDESKPLATYKVESQDQGMFEVRILTVDPEN